MDFQAKTFFGPVGPHGGPKVPRAYVPGSKIIFFCSNPLNKVLVSLPHPQINFLGSNVDLFSNQEADFEAEIISPNGYVGPVLNIFLHKITHTIDECSPNTNVGSWGISAHCADLTTYCTPQKHIFFPSSRHLHRLVIVWNQNSIDPLHSNLEIGDNKSEPFISAAQNVL